MKKFLRYLGKPKWSLLDAMIILPAALLPADSHFMAALVVLVAGAILISTLAVFLEEVN